MTTVAEEMLSAADAAIHAAACGSGPSRLSLPEPEVGPATAALMRRRSVRAFACAELDSELVGDVAGRAVQVAGKVMPSIALELLVILRRSHYFTEATLHRVDAAIPLSTWRPMPASGTGRPLLQEDLCDAAALLVICGRRHDIPDDWGTYRHLLVKAGYMATACAVEVAGAGLAGCLGSGINRPAFWAALGGRAATGYPLLLVAIGVEA